MQNEAWHCPAEMDMEFLGKVVVFDGLHVSNSYKSLYQWYLHMQITHAVGTDAPPYHHRGWFLRFSLVTVWMVFIFGI